MTWQESGARYVSVGERSARFRDLTLRYAVDGEPVETVIWLPNGGGKSSLMALRSAIIQPAARDFVGAGRADGEKRPRRLEDYVESGDASHTVIEHTADDAGSLFGSRRLLTGAVYEWPDRQRPGEDNESRSLTKTWWSAVPKTGVLELETLPVRDGRLLTLSQFRDRMRALNAAHPELQIQFAHTQTAWEEQLVSLGIDTALARYQARMNTSEGGIAKVFRFNTTRDFIDLLIDVIAQPEQSSDISSVLTAHAENLFRKPAWVTEQAFLTEAHTLLSALRHAQAQVSAREAAREDATHRSAELRTSLTLAASQHERAATDARSRSVEHDKAASSARRERTVVDNQRAELQRLAAIDRHQQATVRLEAAQEAQDIARSEVATWAMAAQFAQAAGHDASAQELHEQLQPERAARIDLRARHDAHAAVVYELLESAAGIYDREAATLRAAEGGMRSELTRLESALSGYRGALSQADKQAAGAEALLGAHEKDLAAARRTGLLMESETPQEALDRSERAAETAEGDAKRVSSEAIQLAERSTALAAEASIAASERSGLQVEAAVLTEAERALGVRHEALATHPRLVALAEGDDKVDPWSNAARLRSALADAARDFTGRALAQAVEAAQDERLVAGVDSTGLLPAPVATNAVAEILTAAGVNAQSAWSVLARDVHPTASAQVASSRPDVVSGVVVQDENARTRALAVLSTSAALAHITVVTSSELSEAIAGELGGAPLPSVPLDRGLHDPHAASLVAERLRAAGTARSDRHNELTERAQGDRDLLERLSEFLADHPDPNSVALARQAAAAMRAAVKAANERITALNAESTELARRVTDLHKTALERTSAAAAHRADQGSASKLHEAATATIALRLTRVGAHSAAAAATSSIEATEMALRAAGVQIAANLTEQQAAAGRATELHTQATRIVRLDSTDDPDPEAVARLRAEGLTVVEARYTQLRQQWATAVSTSVLETQLAHAQGQAIEARDRAEQILAKYAGESVAIRAAAAARGVATSVADCDKEQSNAVGAVEASIAAVTTAQNELQRRAEAVATYPDRPGPEPVEYANAEDADVEAERLGHESETLSARETDLRNLSAAETSGAEKREAAARTLQDLADHLPAGSAPANTTAFDGDLDEARQLERTTREALNAADVELARANDARGTLAREANLLANKPTYQSLSLSVRERLAEGDPITLGTKAADYASGVEVRLDRLAELLDQVTNDETRVTTVVAGHVRALLSGIAGAARASMLPPGLGEMSGRQFLTIRFTQPTDEELTSRVKQEILALLDRAKGELKSVPGGESVLRAAVHGSVGVAAFKVHVLKPNEHLIAQQVPVTDVARFSDGEKLTTCVLLFCAFARMRQRGSTAGTATGTLMLDNPFGQASNAQLVGLQLAVAKAQNVHLVYATGLEDMGALAQFRQLIRLRNRKPVDGVGGFVEHERDAARRGEVTGVSVTRPDAPTPAGFGVLATAAPAASHPDNTPAVTL
jgi:hypothetical protein